MVFQYSQPREEEVGTLMDTEKNGGRERRVCKCSKSSMGLKGNAIMKPITKYKEHMLIRHGRRESPQVASQLQTGPPTLEKHQPGENNSGILELCEAPDV